MPLIVDSVKRDLTAVVEWGRQKMQEGDYEKASQHFCMALELRPGFLQELWFQGATATWRWGMRSVLNEISLMSFRRRCQLQSKCLCVDSAIPEASGRPAQRHSLLESLP
ncbi:unnamed protein product [Effrenium voratum]|nr:unnamed protein product [Effrenium voratum]CAJ1433072.1 unnamed protein product [Effrenium voratum]